MTYPKQRNLDGVYFRVKRGDRWTNACWTDMTDDERARVSKDRPAEWWQSLAGHLADCLREIGDHFGIIG